MIRTRTHFLVFLALIALTALTFGLSFARLGALEAPVALGIAMLKAALVGGWFMHLVEHRRPYWLFLFLGGILLALLVGLMALDVATREPRTEPGSSVKAIVPPSSGP